MFRVFLKIVLRICPEKKEFSKKKKRITRGLFIGVEKAQLTKFCYITTTTFVSPVLLLKKC